MPDSTHVRPIYVACPNLSLDRTMFVDEIEIGRVHRGVEGDVRGGGKGVNVARALACIGAQARVAGIVAGRTGDAVRGLLADEGIDVVTTTSPGETRSCLAVIGGDSTTVFNEPGPHVDAAAWRRYRSAIAEWLAPESVFVCSGSWPLGSPEDAAAQLIAMASERGCTTICDTSRAQLAAGLKAHPDVVKPNLDEALAVLHGTEHESVDPGVDLNDVRDAARALLCRGAKSAVVSAGTSGAVLAVDDRTTDFFSPHVNVVNPVGAGDSLVAGTADALARAEPLETSVRWGIAVAAASCETFAAGVLDRSRADELYASNSAI
jgi:tagatose 6-phosphate kinase